MDGNISDLRTEDQCQETKEKCACVTDALLSPVCSHHVIIISKLSEDEMPRGHTHTNTHPSRSRSITYRYCNKEALIFVPKDTAVN